MIHMIEKERKQKQNRNIEDFVLGINSMILSIMTIGWSYEIINIIGKC
jgi:hypothetical protein